MNDFIYSNPTKVCFGKTALDSLQNELLANNVKKVLLVYGGGSIKRTGLYDKVMNKLMARRS